MDPKRQFWNQQQQLLKQALLHPDDHQKSIALFLSQHAMVHASGMAQTELATFEDEIWPGLSEQAIRSIPLKYDHSIAWVIWHIARIEDITMNQLVAGSPQILDRDEWFTRMKVSARDTGNALDGEGVAALSAAIDIEALRAYRLAVGLQTRAVVQGLQPEEMKRKVSSARLKQLLNEGIVVEAASGLLDYWGGLTIAGLLLMPPTRHNFVHLNEALRIKQRF